MQDNSIDLLKRNQDGSFEIIKPKEVQIGDQFVIGFDSTAKLPILKEVKVIHEQRKGKGTYKDESKRPFWAKVS